MATGLETTKPLVWERLERGWRQEDVTQNLNLLMRKSGEAGHAQVTAHAVGRWERGDRRPDPAYRKFLVLLYQRTASELGLLTDQELRFRPNDEDADAVATRVRESLRLSETAPLFSRKAFLKGVLGAGSTFLLKPDASLGEATQVLARLTVQPALSTEDIDAYATISEAQLHLYWDSPSHVIFDAAMSHMQLGLHLLQAADNRPPPDFAHSLALSALLVGRVAFFDLQQPAVAERCMNTAKDIARFGDDPQLRAVIAGTIAFISGFAGDTRLAYAWLDRAHKHLRSKPGPLLKSWLHCVSSEIASRNGDLKKGVQQILEAEDALGGKGTDPEWLDFYNESRLASFAGFAYLEAREYVKATTYLERSLDALGEHDSKQRSVVLLDLASAYADAEPEMSLDYAQRALEQLRADWYAIGFDRVDRVRMDLPDDRYRQRLDEMSATAADNWI